MTYVTHVAFNPMQNLKRISFISSGYHYAAFLHQLPNEKWVFLDTIIHEGLENEYCPYCNKQKEEIDAFDTPCLYFLEHLETSTHIFVELKEHPLLAVKLLINGIIFDEQLVGRSSSREEKVTQLFQRAHERNEEILAFSSSYEQYCPSEGVLFPCASTEKELLRFSCPYKLEKHSIFSIWINEKGNVETCEKTIKEIKTNQYGIKKDFFRNKAKENKEKAIKLIFEKEKIKPKKTKHCLAGIYFIHWCYETDYHMKSFEKFIKSSEPEEIKEAKWYLFDDYKEDFRLFARDWVVKEERKEYLTFCKNKQKVKA